MMEDYTSDSATNLEHPNGGIKRKRSVSLERQNVSAPPTKTFKSSGHGLHINYLVRQNNDTLPLLTVDDSVPAVLQLLIDYGGVLDRHESLASNMGARALGPILINRFERLFDGPPIVLKNHGKEGNTVTWLDVVEFARHKPEQFNLEKHREGIRVCQFYTKQCRVEISEEDYLLVASGMPQKLIPPQPIAEDEEKELGTIEILEKNLGQLINLSDQGEQIEREFLGLVLSYVSICQGSSTDDSLEESSNSDWQQARLGIAGLNISRTKAIRRRSTRS